MSRWIEELSYGTISGGAKNGLVMYEARFGGGEPSSDREIVDAYSAIVAHHGRRCSRVHICGTFPTPDKGHIEALISSLRSAGFEIFITTSSPIWRSWFSEAIWRTVELSEPNWAAYPFSELVYSLCSKDQPDPIMPGTINRSANLLYLKPQAPLTTSDAFDFISRSKHLWNIWTETKRAKEIILPQEDIA